MADVGSRPLVLLWPKRYRLNGGRPDERFAPQEQKDP
jgi:hypothetical protein